MMERTHRSETELRTATFSRCEAYRYRLTIEWEPLSLKVAVIGLNPSTATELVDDNTVRRLKKWARDFGFGGLHMLNAYAYRSTDPKGLLRVDDPVGQFTDEWIGELVESAGMVVCCWGGNISPDREQQLLELLSGKGTAICCFAVTKTGRPGHPLYLKSPLVAKEFDTKAAK